MRISDWSSDGCSSDLSAASRHTCCLASRKTNASPATAGISSKRCRCQDCQTLKLSSHARASCRGWRVRLMLLLDTGFTCRTRVLTATAYIAATALVHGMTVVTRNVTDFESTGVCVKIGRAHV